MAERTYRIHVAAELVGISEGLLRAWERRYGVVKPKRTAGGYRAYTEQDIEVLRRLKRLTEEGVAIAEAAQLLPQIRKELKAPEAPPPAPVDGSQVERWRKGVLAAAERGDQLAIEQLLDEALASLPPLLVHEQVLVPVQREVGERWHAGTLSVEREHLVTQVVRARLSGVLRGGPSRERHHHVVCACFPEEDHDVGLLGVALRFRTAGWQVTYLGPRTPAADLGRLVAAVSPQLVGLSAVVDSGRRAFTSQLRHCLDALPPRTQVIVGGAAAERYPEVCREQRARMVLDDDEWRAVLA